MRQEGTHTAPGGVPARRSGIRAARQFLLEARPEAVDRCQTALQRVVDILEAAHRGENGLHRSDPLLSAALLRIRRSALGIQLQIEYASNLCSGWLQLRLGAGYTDQGLPVLVTDESASKPGHCSFEA